MSRNKTTWREMISRALDAHGESWADVVSMTLTEADLDARFDSGYGGTEGCPFTLWTANRVYFPASYDGAEWCDSVARNPNGEATPHVGGG